MFRYSSLLFACAMGAHAQSLYDAMSQVPELSNLTTFLNNNKAFADGYFANTSLYPITFLAPSNTAFAILQSLYGTNLEKASLENLLQIIQYHTLVSNLTATDFDNSGKAGLTVPTMLNTNNDRSVGDALAARFGGLTKAQGQVVFVTGSSSASRKYQVMARQNSGQPLSSVRSGLSQSSNIQTLDSKGIWTGGRFHVIDGILTPPDLCTKTIRTANLTNLDNALNRTQLWNAVDSTKNITCLAPNNDAFKNVGYPDNTLNTTDLTGALLFHTLPSVTYTDYLYDGQEFKSLQNGTVRVRVVQSGKDRVVYFNNAKVIDANVLTHNGLIHVLDAVMKSLEQLNGTDVTKPTSSSSAPRPSSTKSVAAVTDAMFGRWTWASWLVISSILLLL